MLWPFYNFIHMTLVLGYYLLYNCFITGTLSSIILLWRSSLYHHICMFLFCIIKPFDESVYKTSTHIMVGVRVTWSSQHLIFWSTACIGGCDHLVIHSCQGSSSRMMKRMLFYCMRLLHQFWLQTCLIPLLKWYRASTKI